MQVGHVRKYAPSLPGGSTPRICLPETLFTGMERILPFSPSRSHESTRPKRFLLRCIASTFVASLVQVGHVRKYAPSLPGGSTPRICLPETLFTGMERILPFSPSRSHESTRPKRFLLRCIASTFVASLVQVGHVRKYAPSPARRLDASYNGKAGSPRLFVKNNL